MVDPVAAVVDRWSVVTAPVRYGPGDRLDATVDDPAAGGTYVLVFDLATRVSTEVGALGVCEFPAGAYAYVGSAFGPGGFSRVDRHRRHLAGDEASVPRHVDALTTRPEASFVVALLAPDADVECAVARRLSPGPVDGFGSSDCDCRTHLSTCSDGTTDCSDGTTDRWVTALVDAVATGR